MIDDKFQSAVSQNSAAGAGVGTDGSEGRSGRIWIRDDWVWDDRDWDWAAVELRVTSFVTLLAQKRQQAPVREARGVRGER